MLILTLFSATLMLTGVSLSPVATATTAEKVNVTKESANEKFWKFESQDKLLSSYLKNNFTLTWQTLLTKINKKDLKTQIKAIETISNLHINEVKNLKELKNVEVKLKALHTKVIAAPDVNHSTMKWLHKQTWSEEIKKFVFKSQEEFRVMHSLTVHFALTWRHLLIIISKKDLETQIKTIQAIGNLHPSNFFALNEKCGQIVLNKESTDIVQKLKVLRNELYNK